MGEKELDIKESIECVFNNIDLITSLSEGRIPEDLEDRLEFTKSFLEDGTEEELYIDKETGDALFKNSKLFKEESFFKASVIIKTGVGKYEIINYYREFGCTGEKYFFNDIETDKEIFVKILREQEELPLE